MITAIQIIQRSLSRLYNFLILLLFQILAYWKKLIIRHFLSLTQVVKIFLPLLNTAGESLCRVVAVSACNRYDVAFYRSKVPFISDIENKYLIKNVFVPDDNFSFPETNRSFKSEWFKWFPWLCYSPSENPVYCLVCVLFGHKFPKKASKFKKFYSQPFRH